MSLDDYVTFRALSDGDAFYVLGAHYFRFPNDILRIDPLTKNVEPISQKLEDYQIYDISVNDDCVISLMAVADFVNSKPSLLSFSFDHGATWTNRYLPDSISGAMGTIEFVNQNNGVLIAANTSGNTRGALFVTKDGGRTWRRVESRKINYYIFVNPPDYMKYPVAWINDSTVVCVYDVRRMMMSKDRGEHWIDLKDPALFGDRIMKIVFPTEEVGYVTDNAGGVCKTTDGGMSWIRIGQFQFGKVFSSYAVNIDTVLFGTDAGILICTFDGGITWEIKNWDGIAIMNTIRFVDDQYGYILASLNGGGRNQKVFTTHDGGVSLSEVYSSGGDTLLFDVSSPVKDVLFFALHKQSNDIYSLVRFEDNKTLRELLRIDKAATGEEIKRVGFISNDTGFVVTNRRIIKTNSGGGSWHDVFAIPAGNGGILWDMNVLSSDYKWLKTTKKLYRSAEDGETWSEVTPMDTSNVLMIRAMSIISSREVYLRIVKKDRIDYIYHTNDFGATWSGNIIPSFNEPLKFVFTKSGRSYGIFTSFIAFSDDMWATKQIAYFYPAVDGGMFNYDIFFLDDMNGWVTGKNGAIFRTTNGGTTWIKERGKRDNRVILDQNYPNPFTSQEGTVIRFTIRGLQDVFAVVEVYDIEGKQVDIPFEGMVQSGVHDVRWKTEKTQPGVYFVILNVDGWRRIRKIVLTK